MTNIRLYLDEEATSNRLLQSLRNDCVDVVSTLEVDMLSQPDEKQLEWASTNQRVIYSFNVKDFYRLHSEWLLQGKNPFRNCARQTKLLYWQSVKRIAKNNFDEIS
ncbi:MAG: DUF5615 family PIN-like protein [Microcoleaceae cyanobacterium]